MNYEDGDELALMTLANYKNDNSSKECQKLESGYKCP